MEPPSASVLVSLGLLLPFSILFSAFETAFASITKAELEEMKNDKTKISDLIVKLHEKFPNETIITLLLGNNLVNIAISTIAAIATHTMISSLSTDNWNFFIDLSTFAFIMEVGVVGTTILLLGEIIPKIVAIRNHLQFVKKTVAIIYFFYIIFGPITFFLALLVAKVSKKIGNLNNDFAKAKLVNVESLMKVVEEQDNLEEDEKNMLNSIMVFGKKRAKEIMVPRVDMKAIEDDISKEELLDFMKTYNFSRIPVFNGTIDNIVGILYTKSLYAHLNNPGKEMNLKSAMKEVTFVPDSKDLGDLLKLFQKKKIHIAIVVDEYGGTAGMVTLEDIIEEIVGEIQDEFDNEEKIFEEKEPNVYRVNARIDIDELNHSIGEEIIEDKYDFETLGGYLYNVFGEIPQKGDQIDDNNMIIKILSVNKQRIGMVELRIKEKIDNDGNYQKESGYDFGESREDNRKNNGNK